jgi:hypothetical protein
MILPCILVMRQQQVYHIELKSEISADNTTGFVSPLPTSAEGKQQARLEIWTLPCRKLLDFVT